MTTLKVRRSTREAVASAARAAGLTADAYLQRLLTEELWRQRMAQAKADMATADSLYTAEVTDWDALASDGLDDD